MNLRAAHLTLLFAAVLAVTGCDSTTDDLSQQALEDAAVSIANAVALDSGGALDEAAHASVGSGLNATEAPEGQALAGDAVDNGCALDWTAEAATKTWTRAVACTFSGSGPRGGQLQATFGRQQRLAYTDGGTPTLAFGQADAVAVDVLGGYGTRTSPWVSHELTNVDGAYTVSGLNDTDDLVTLNGTHTRSASDVLTTRTFTRTLDYTLDLAFVDLVGPAGNRAEWEANADQISGTLRGTYQADIVFDGDRRYNERSVDLTFEVTFANGQGTLVLNGESFPFNPTTGEVEDVE